MSKIKRKLTPCGDRVLVKLRKFEEVSAGGIVIASDQLKSAEQFAMQEAYVIAIGPDAFKYLGSGHPYCKEGDLVVISKYAGEDRRDIEDGEIYRLILCENIHGVFEGESLND